MQIHIAVVAGTRPEAIKLAPLIKALRVRPGIETTLILSGQHPQLAREALTAFGLSPDFDLAIANPGMTTFCTALDTAIENLFDEIEPDLVLVQGDTNTAWVTAHAAHRLGISLGHVEAGLRSGHLELPWPEERNRQEIDALSALLFTPCPRATRETKGLAGLTFEVGNTGIDALFGVIGRRPPRTADRIRNLLVTCHRREAAPHLPDLALALRTLANRDDVRVCLPLHPNPAFADGLTALLLDHPHIRLDPPQPYHALAEMLAEADLLLTDSGGLQEEAPALGLPTLVLRSVTERWEPIESGHARLVGLDPQRIIAETSRLLDDPLAYAAMATPSFPYGRGDASIRIADAIELWWGQAALRFPYASPSLKGAGHGRNDNGDELDAR